MCLELGPGLLTGFYFFALGSRRLPRAFFSFTIQRLKHGLCIWNCSIGFVRHTGTLVILAEIGIVTLSVGGMTKFHSHDSREGQVA
jgi:hypothetical protein